MKIGSLSKPALAFTAAALGIALYANGSHADPRVAPASMPRRAAPVVQEPAKRVVKMAEAMKIAGLVGSPPQTLETRLTPLSPRAGSASITMATPISFNGPATDEPDGSYTLLAAKTAFAITQVQMRFPTENGKLYIADCRMNPPAGSNSMKVVFARPGAASGHLPVDNGHVYYAFPATGTSTELTVTVVPDGASDIRGYWYGCDFGKAG